jgi:hypothetical protein
MDSSVGQYLRLSAFICGPDSFHFFCSRDFIHAAYSGDLTKSA